MNKKVLRKINAKVDTLLIEWIQSILSEEEAVKVTKENYKELLPAEEHILSNGTCYQSFYTHRWAKLGIKKLMKAGKELNDITIEDLEWILKRLNLNNQSKTL
jgi:hypothetical protein